MNEARQRAAAFDWYDADGLAATGNATLDEPISPDGTPAPGASYTVPPRQGRAVRLARGRVLTMVNTHGTQVVDTWAFDAADPSEFMSLEHYRQTVSRVMVRVGDPLATNRRRPILTLVEDTSPGVHDTVIAACDIWRYLNLGVAGYHDSCTDNLRMAMLAIGMEAPEIPQPLNMWMNIPIHTDGTVGWMPTVAAPGDAVKLRAERDCIVVMSCCPQDLVPINGPGGVIREITFHVDAG